MQGSDKWSAISRSSESQWSCNLSRIQENAPPQDIYCWGVDEEKNFVENEDEQYCIENMKTRYYEDNMSISQITREPFFAFF